MAQYSSLIIVAQENDRNFVDYHNVVIFNDKVVYEVTGDLFWSDEVWREEPSAIVLDRVVMCDLKSVF